MSVTKYDKPGELHSPHPSEPVERVENRPTEYECCDFSVCDLETQGVDDGVRDMFEDPVLLLLRDLRRLLLGANIARAF